MTPVVTMLHSVALLAPPAGGDKSSLRRGWRQVVLIGNSRGFAVSVPSAGCISAVPRRAGRDESLEVFRIAARSDRDLMMGEWKGVPPG